MVELKLLRSSDETVGQILRYIGWVKENLAREDGNVQGLIISDTADAYIKYALKGVSDIELKVYRMKNGKLVFNDPEIVDLSARLKNCLQRRGKKC